MSALPNCPECHSSYTYEDQDLYVCPECAHEWTSESDGDASIQQKVYKDANGNLLVDGDTVMVIKDLIDGIGAMKLKSEFVRKV